MSSVRLLYLSMLLGIVIFRPLDVGRTAEDPGRDRSPFGLLRVLPSSEVRPQAEAWLKAVGKVDRRSQKEFQDIWDGNRPILDKVAQTFILGDPVAAKLLMEARDVTAAPMDTPAIFKDRNLSKFYRANLALAYARILSTQKIYEESLVVLRLFMPEEVVDPSAYLFHRAVAEHALMEKKAAGISIFRLLEDVPDSPDRYKSLAALMMADMLGWKTKDLGWIARKMHNSEWRLELARGGKKTQKIQKDLLAQLDVMIKQLEQQGQGQGEGQAQGGGAPGRGGAPADNPNSGGPQSDSIGGHARGSGAVDAKRFRETARIWGKLPEKERAKAMLELTRDMPARYRQVIENYFKELAKRSDSPQ